MIEEYKFGSITINGKTYNHDVEARWTGEILKWWRGESHIIDLEDVERAIAENPDLIIIGIGAWGVAEVTERAKAEIKNKGIELVIDNTEEAVKTFNIRVQESKEEGGRAKKVIGLFHLTC
jgi:hypothetical protein